MPKLLTVSIVIPAYNEEDQLRTCLEMIARQTVKPFEVIVVDNNSTDTTAAIARSFRFVKLINQPMQGVVFARDAGFDAARGDIIGRIDADTHLPPDWVASVQKIFLKTSADALSGAINYYDVPLKMLFARVDLFLRRTLARRLAHRNELFLYGGNMALTREFWQALRGQVCRERALHEDIDLAAHAAHGPHRIIFTQDLVVGVSGRRVDSSVGSFWSYVLGNGRTLAAHGLRARFYVYPIEWFLMLLYPGLRLLYRGYDVGSGKFSFVRMVRPPQSPRISPISESI